MNKHTLGIRQKQELIFRRQITQHITSEFDVKISEIVKHSQTPDIKTARAVYAYFIYTFTTLTQNDISVRLGRSMRTISRYILHIRGLLNSTPNSIAYKQDKALIERILKIEHELQNAI